MTQRLRAVCLFAAIALSVGLLFALSTELAPVRAMMDAADRIIPKPRAFGTFHLICLSICAALSIGAGICGAKRGKRHCDDVLFFAGLLLLILEVWKQAYSYFILNDRVFDFGFFPFQFCSLPLYLYLLVPFLREGKRKELLYCFLALYGTMGGCLVMGYPAFYDRAALCVHTMLWHTVMIAIGVYLLFARNYGKSWRREVLPASVPFLLAVGIATLLNVALAPMAAASPNPLDLLYMSPYRANTRYFVIRDVQKAFGWGASMLTYCLLFIFVGASMVFLVTRLLRAIAALAKKSKSIQKK